MIGKTYMSLLEESMLKVVGRPILPPIALNRKIYAREGTAMINTIYSVPSLSMNLSFLRAMIMPSGTPRKYEMNVEMIPMVKE